MMLVLLCAFAPTALAAGEDLPGMDALTRGAEEYLEGYLAPEELDSGDFVRGMEAVLEGGGEEARGALRRAVRSGVLLLTVAMLCGMSESVRGELGGDGLDPVRLCGAAAITAIAVADVHSLMGLGREAIGQMDAFAKLLLPVVTAACAAAGLTVSAAARQGVILLFLNLLLTVVDRFLLPLCYGYVAVAVAGSALGNRGLDRLAGFLKWMCAGLLSLLFSGFVLYLTVTGAVGRNADAAAQKAAKTAVSAVVPVVGGVLSDAAESLIAGAGVLRGTVGVLGMLTVASICVGPFLYLGCHYLVYKLTAALAATVTAGPASDLIDALGSAFALVLGMTGGEALLLYVALVTSIKAVSP